MARKYIRQGAVDARGMRDMTVEQVEFRGKANETRREITYRTFGDEGAPESAVLFGKAVAAMVADPSQAGTLAEWYGQWVYGVDLDARQENKTGGPVGTVVSISKNEEMDLVTGAVLAKATKAATGRVVPLADRIEVLNLTVAKARVGGLGVPKQVAEAVEALTARGEAKMEGGRVVAMNGKGAPAKK